MKEKRGVLGQVTAGRAELLAGWKVWPAVEKCLLKLSIIVDLLVVTVFPSRSGQLGGAVHILHGL